MSTTQPTHETVSTGRRSTGRPEYIHLGVDGAGADHIYRTFDETVLVIDETEREHVECLGPRSIDDWMAFVEDRRGWADRRMWDTLGDAIAESLEADR